MICIYHSRDLDGYSSGAIVKHKYPEAKLIGYDYGKPIPWDEIPQGEEVIMVDVSLPMNEMVNLAIYCGNLTWIDHHISAINDFHNYFTNEKGFNFNREEAELSYGGGGLILHCPKSKYTIKAVLQNGIAACEITWEHLFGDLPMPDSIKFLGQYDTWRKAEVGDLRWQNEILAFQFGMRMICKNPETFPTELLKSSNDENYDEAKFQELMTKILNNGITILEYQGQINERACQSAFEFEFKGHRCICLNGGGFNSDVFKSVWDPEKYDIMMPFIYNGKHNHWTFSVYSDKPDIDCSKIAKEMGGGGHKSAAGFQVNSLNEVFNF